MKSLSEIVNISIFEHLERIREPLLLLSKQ